MTILPKKKQQKDKADADNTERPHSPSGPGESRGSARRPVSPGQPRWSSPPPVEHERHAVGHDDSMNCPHGNLNVNKRRLRDRSPPHRNTRKQRHDNGTQQQRGVVHVPAIASAGHCRLDPQRGQGKASTSTESNRSITVPIGHIAVAGLSQDLDEINSGYNSEDECHRNDSRDTNYDESDRWFETALKEKRGFIIKKMGEDGACLFRSVADQVFGDQEMHSVVRQNCVDYMAKNIDFFKQYVTEDFTMYLNRKRMEHCHGNHIEMQALSELYNRPIEVYQSGHSDHCIKPINTFHGAYTTDNDPIRLSYHRNIHYNSVIDPCKATIGVGLGLPGFQPGLADKNLIRDAVRMSEDYQIEQTMLEDKLRETDWELTQETIEEQVARESYLQWLQDQEKNAKTRSSPRSACATCSTASDAPTNWWDMTEPRSSRSPRSNTSNTDQGSPAPVEYALILDEKLTDKAISAGSVIPLYSAPSTSKSIDAPVAGVMECEAEGGATGGMDFCFRGTTCLKNELPPELYGLSEYDDEDDVMARVIAQSQQEYFNILKKSVMSTQSSEDTDCTSSKGKSRMPKDTKH